MRVGVPSGELVPHVFSLLLEFFLPLHLLLLPLLSHMQLLMNVSVPLSPRILCVDDNLLFASLGLSPYLVLIVPVCVYLAGGLVCECCADIVHLGPYLVLLDFFLE